MPGREPSPDAPPPGASFAPCPERVEPGPVSELSRNSLRKSQKGWPDPNEPATGHRRGRAGGLRHGRRRVPRPLHRRRAPPGVGLGRHGRSRTRGGGPGPVPRCADRSLGRVAPGPARRHRPGGGDDAQRLARGDRRGGAGEGPAGRGRQAGDPDERRDQGVARRGRVRRHRRRALPEPAPRRRLPHRRRPARPRRPRRAAHLRVALRALAAPRCHRGRGRTTPGPVRAPASSTTSGPTSSTRPSRSSAARAPCTPTSPSAGPPAASTTTCSWRSATRVGCGPTSGRAPSRRTSARASGSSGTPPPT